MCTELSSTPKSPVERDKRYRVKIFVNLSVLEYFKRALLQLFRESLENRYERTTRAVHLYIANYT